MAQFAPVCPIHLLEEMQHRRFAGTYHLPLAHDVVRHPARYYNLFSRMYPRKVILDNSVIELGSSVNLDVIREAADSTQADVIVLPDVLLDKDATIEACSTALENWSGALKIDKSSNSRKFMIVPQGRTLSEWIECAEHFANHPLIGWWGIGRFFREHNIGSRQTAVRICRTLNNYRDIHLLGFSDDLLDDVLTAQTLGVRGIDSAVPIRAASLNMKLSLSPEFVLPPRGNWWDDPATQYVDLMQNNVQTIREWIVYG